MNKFKKGDTVLLNSDDNILMTVSDIIDGYVRCTWFTPNHDRRDEAFDPSMLRKVERK